MHKFTDVVFIICVVCEMVSLSRGSWKYYTRRITRDDLKCTMLQQNKTVSQFLKVNRCSKSRTFSLRNGPKTLPPAHDAEHSDQDVCSHTNSVTLIAVTFGVNIVYVYVTPLFLSWSNSWRQYEDHIVNKCTFVCFNVFILGNIIYIYIYIYINIYIYIYIYIYVCLFFYLLLHLNYV